MSLWPNRKSTPELSPRDQLPPKPPTSVLVTLMLTSTLPLVNGVEVDIHITLAKVVVSAALFAILTRSQPK
jgi:hypothetical protein